MKFTRHSNSVLLAGASALALTIAAPAAMAQDEDTAAPRTLSTIVVTTQKRDESIQDVPIAVSAFDPENLDRLNISTGQDLQFNIPNFQASQGNFSAGSISIRGIANAAVGASSDAAVGTHINGVPSSGSFVLETEFYDMERVEILRGPQGTLYGRNATGGVLNAVTAKPQLGEFSGKIEGTYGEFNNRKLTGFLNVPLGENFGARIAGFYLKRDGYSTALLPDGSSNKVDGRDLWAMRATFGGDLTERASFWAMYERYEEDSSRTRGTKQLCTKDDRPFPFNQGCVPYVTDGLGYARNPDGSPVQVVPGFGTVDSSGTLGGVLAANLGLYPSFGTDSNAGATTSRNLREFETNLLPEFNAQSDRFQAEFQYEMDNGLTLTLLGSFNDNSRLFTDDYNKGIGTTAFSIGPLTPDLDGDGDGDFIGGTAGGLTFPVETRLRAPADTLLATDRSSSEFETTSFEARIQSDFDGPFNFTAGALKLDAIGETNYFVFFNTAEALGIATGLPGDRTYFLSRSPYKLKALGAFGEAYYNVSDDLKLTLGLRYTDDSKRQENTPSLLLAPASVFPGELNGFAQGGPVQLANFKEVTGRVGFDLNMDSFLGSDDTLLYGFLSRGYKGGGINPPQSAGLVGVGNTFEPEFINSIEVGTKSSLFGSTAALNLSAFYYDYKGYQISSIINRSSINQNVDAKILGFEGELYWQASDNFRIDTTWGFLNAELSDQDPLLDTYDQTGGDPNYLVVKNPATTQNCVVNAAQFAALDAAIGGTPLAATYGLLCTPAALNATVAGFLGQPTADALTPTDVLEGIAVDVSGNKLPRAPKATFSVGAQYEWFFDNGWDASIRGDFYYQADMFTRIFNLEADRIESWQNVNASFTVRNEDKGLELEFYGKNLVGEDQITNQYLTDASSGLWTNTFLLEPRQFGVRVAKTW